MLKSRWFHKIVIVGAVLIIVAGGGILYTQSQIEDVPLVDTIQENAVLDYVNENTELKRVQDNHFSMTIPLDIIEEEITYNYIQNWKDDSKITILGAVTDLEAGTLKANFEHNGLKTSMTSQIIMEEDGLTYTFEVSPVWYGALSVHIPKVFQGILLGSLAGTKTVSIDLSDCLESDYFQVDEGKLTQDGMKLDIEMSIPDIAEWINQIKANMNQGLVEIYSQGTDNQKEALRWIEEFDDYPGSIQGAMYDDYISGHQVLENLLALVKSDDLDQLLEDYPELEELDIEGIEQRRDTLMDAAMIQIGQKVLESAYDWIDSSNMVSVDNHFYDTILMREVTVEDLNEDDSLGIEEGQIDNFDLIYTEDKNIYVLYKTAGGNYILVKNTGYGYIDEEEYEENYALDPLGEGQITEDTSTYHNIYQAIEDYYGEPVYIRYMKDDGNQAFAVISLVVDYQKIRAITLEKKADAYDVLDEGFSDIESLNNLDPTFNLNLATKDFERTKIVNLNYSTLQNIKEGLISNGYLSEDQSIVYASYDGTRYIDVMTEDQEQYVYTIYRSSFLESVYTLEDALDRFDDIDSLITLQGPQE